MVLSEIVCSLDYNIRLVGCDEDIFIIICITVGSRGMRRATGSTLSSSEATNTRSGIWIVGCNGSAGIWSSPPLGLSSWCPITKSKLKRLWGGPVGCSSRAFLSSGSNYPQGYWRLPLFSGIYGSRQQQDLRVWAQQPKPAVPHSHSNTVWSPLGDATRRTSHTCCWLRPWK